MFYLKMCLLEKEACSWEEGNALPMRMRREDLKVRMIFIQHLALAVTVFLLILVTMMI